MKRRAFISKTAMGTAALAAVPVIGCAPDQKVLQISLAQWSLHRNFNDGTLDPVDFAAIAMEKYGIQAVEYVNSFYRDRVADETFWNQMKARSSDAGVKNWVMMVDDEGDLGTADKNERLQSVENHYKWVHAANLLGCRTMRVNAFGDPDREVYRASIMDAMARLADYAAQFDLNIVIENHGLFSSDAELIAGIIKEVNRPNFGSLPDFGNWCLSAKWGTTQGECDEVYDRYKGVAEMLPYAKAVSAKSYNFNAQGEDTKIDYYRMMKMVKESDYNGFTGIEYEGEEKSEHEGILLTRDLMIKAWDNA
jgi:sugar phosphate isomerase/epimerase